MGAPRATPPAPVFVDDTGGRRRKFRRAGASGALLSAAYLALVVVGLTGHGPLAGIRLPFLGGAHKAHTVAVVDQPPNSPAFGTGDESATHRPLTLVADRHSSTPSPAATAFAIAHAASRGAARGLSLARTTISTTLPATGDPAPVASATTSTTFVPGSTNASTHGRSSTAPGQTTNGRAGNPPGDAGTPSTNPGKSVTDPGNVDGGTVNPPNGKRASTSR